MINKTHIKMANDVAKSVEALTMSLPKILASMEKNIDAEQIELIRNAKDVSQLDNRLKDLTKAQKDFDQFMKQYGGKIK